MKGDFDVVSIVCPQCGKCVEKSSSGAPIYCGRKCFGLSRRLNKSEKQKKREKQAYDKEYRALNKDIIRNKKAKWFRENYDPIEASKKRKERSVYHLEYCRSTEYREWKREYDRRYRAKKNYGPYWEAFLMSQELTAEIDRNATRYDIAIENGTLNKAKKRRFINE